MLLRDCRKLVSQMEAEARKAPYKHRTITELIKEMPDFTEWLIQHDKMLDLYPDFFLVLRDLTSADSDLNFRSYFTEDNYIEGEKHFQKIITWFFKK